MPTRTSRPRLLVVFYANPDDYPPTYNAVSLLAEHFDVRVVCRKTERESRLWPAGLSAPAFVPSEPVLANEPHAFAPLQLAGCHAPIVYQRHEVEELDSFDRRSLGGWVSRLALRRNHRAAQMVFPKAARAEYYTRFARPPAAPLVIPNYPFLHSFPRPDLSKFLPQRAEDRVVFYRGNLGVGNGILEAIRAMPAISAATRLRLCGRASSEFEQMMRATAQRCAVTARVELAGFVPFDTLNQQSLAASVGLMLYQAVDTNWTNIAPEGDRRGD